ncbi:hypothetical protein H340_10320 [Streptomyces mobaraensis NBRC 13819 = DSM 40847]|uniref:Uncharacterized protein n=1 Tax=Streptomyces mobaraensis (strain ATCC 29032 / DSM 40847 / JCM 4168 / NBRC 13819 / NCIMB 11159 / IPCR 16-22) TaxID=1223523 RepID=M3C9J8_STRM1|nr:hypothetical protein H340_10320 [Streptomyces mobaraensis NBRC 13819 = DSM 40847]
MPRPRRTRLQHTRQRPDQFTSDLCHRGASADVTTGWAVMARVIARAVATTAGMCTAGCLRPGGAMAETAAMVAPRREDGVPMRRHGS